MKMIPARPRGLGLVELLLGLGLVALLLALALPAFRSVVDQTRAETVANRLRGEMALARSEAVTQRQSVILCRTRDFERCIFDGPWSAGLMTFVDHNGNRNREPSEPVLRVHPPSDFQGLLVVGSQGRPVLGFRPDGRAAGSNTTLRFCSRDGQPRRYLVINNGGRVRGEIAPPTGRNCLLG